MPSYLKVFGHLADIKGAKGDPADHVFDAIVPGTRSQVHVEVLFRAVNDLDLEEFFRGFEFTALWLPEADTNADLAALISLGSNRAGRYPEPDDRPEGAEDAAYSGIFGDANAPMIGNAFHRRFYLRQLADGTPAPKADQLFIQPGGFSANAENMHNLRKIRRDYYEHMASQLDAYDINRLINNRPGYGRHGQPVHPNFDQETHVAKRLLEIDPYSPVYIGVDCGSNSMTPGATFSQRAYSGQWRTLAEIYIGKSQMNTQELGQAIRQIYAERFAGLNADVGAMLCLDLAAASRNAGSQYTTALELQHHTGIEAQLSPTNTPTARRGAMDRLFKRMVAPGEPAKIIDPRCIGLIQGYAGGFHYQRRGVIVSPAPAKNEFSHVCEADEYAALTVEGMDASESPFIRLGGAGDHDRLNVMMQD